MKRKNTLPLCWVCESPHAGEPRGYGSVRSGAHVTYRDEDQYEGQRRRGRQRSRAGLLERRVAERDTGGGEYSSLVTDESLRQ
eukprot:2904872-Pyramimonas_sp.AAC.1